MAGEVRSPNAREIAGGQTGTPALTLGVPLDSRAISEIERTLNLNHYKWDSRLAGSSTLFSQPLLISKREWAWICNCAERLAAETIALEMDLCRTAELIAQLGMPDQLWRCLRNVDWSRNSMPVRTMRFDFHRTTCGWKVSEVNSDVPGGYTEAVWLPALFGQFRNYGRRPPSPLTAWGAAMECALTAPNVVFVSAPGYLEDHQVVQALTRELTTRRISCHWIHTPSALQWDKVHAIGGIVRFYQAEWLSALPRRTNWPQLMSYTGLMSNPAISVFGESKRFPLVWRQLSASSSKWQSVLPECREVTAVLTSRREDWVLKAAYSNTGDSVVIGDQTTSEEWQCALRTACREHKRWVAQRKFDTVALDSIDGAVYPCVGVFVINGKAAGAYVRLSHNQLINGLAMEAPLFIQPDEESWE